MMANVVPSTIYSQGGASNFHVIIRCGIHAECAPGGQKEKKKKGEKGTRVVGDMQKSRLQFGPLSLAISKG